MPELRTITTCHRIITAACRETHGDEGAWEQALRDVRGGYETLKEVQDGRPGTKIHLKIEVEYDID